MVSYGIKENNALCQTDNPTRKTISHNLNTNPAVLQQKMQLVIVFFAFLQITSALVIKVRPARVRGQVRMRRPPLGPFPMRFVPLAGAGFRRPRPTIRPRTHIHVPFNGRQFEHTHANGDVAHGHNFGFPAGIYPEHGVGWDIPEFFRDSNTWAIFDKVNPDSVFVQDDEGPVYQPDNIPNNIPDVMTSNDGAMFPDSIVPSDVEVPMITSEFLPTSNKRGEPAITRPLTPIVKENTNDSIVPKTNGTDNSTNVNKGWNNPGSPPSTDKTVIIVEKTTREPSCHKT